MKTLISLFILSFAPYLKAEEDKWSILIQTCYATKYVGKPGILFYDGPVWVNEFKIKHNPTSLYGGVWDSLSFADDPSLGDYGDEINCYFGYEKSFEYVRFDIRANYIALSQLNQAYDDRFAIDLRAEALSLKYIIPYFSTRYFGRFTDDISEGGWFVWMGIKGSLPLFKVANHEKKMTLLGDIQVAYSDGALARDVGIIYGRATLSLDIPVRDHISVVPSVTYQLPSGDQTGGTEDYAKKPETIWSIAVKLTY